MATIFRGYRATMGSLWFVLYFLVLRDRYWTIVYNRDTCERIRTNKKII